MLENISTAGQTTLENMSTEGQTTLDNISTEGCSLTLFDIISPLVLMFSNIV
jgi:hypothetical protein